MPCSRRVLAVLGAALLVLAVAGTAAAHLQSSATTSAAKPLVVAINQVGEVYDPTSVLPSTISVVDANVFDCG